MRRHERTPTRSIYVQGPASVLDRLTVEALDQKHDALSSGGAEVLPELQAINGGFDAPGIPMLFMGQEFLSWGYFDPSQPLDWSHANTFAGIVNLYRDLIRLRRNWFNNTRGLRGNNTHVHHK